MKKLFLSLGVILMLYSCGNNSQKNSSTTNDDSSLMGNFQIEYVDSVPTDLTAQRMLDQLDYQRAVQTYLWALPSVGLHQYRLTTKDAMGGGTDEYKVAYLGTLLKPNIVHLTGNPDAMYIDYFVDTRKGPVAVEIPTKLTGFIDDMWQVPVVDVMPQVSANGKYLIVAPGWEGKTPAGFKLVRPKTFVSWLFLRGPVTPDGSGAEAVEIMKTQLKIYPLGEPSKHKLEFFDVSDAKIDRVLPEGLKYFELLADLVKNEHPDMQDTYVTGMFHSLGIKVGKDFNPDDRMKQILTAAAKTGQAMARTLSYNKDDSRLIWEDRHYLMPLKGGKPDFVDEGGIMHDSRINYFYVACGMSNMMTTTIPGLGQAYPSAMKTNEGKFLSGAKYYKLRLNAPIPAREYWSVTVYDINNRSMLDVNNEVPRISTYTGPTINEDGSVDIYFGPEVIAGKEKNFVKTIPQKGWFYMIRLYGPEKEYLDGQWKPDDIIEVQLSDIK